MNMRKKQGKSMIMLLLTAIIWGFAFVAQRKGTESIGPLAYNGIRFMLGVISMIPVVLIFEKEKADKAKKKRTAVAALLAGVILFTASTLQQYGVLITQSAGKSGFITGLYTVLVPIIGFFFLKRKTCLTVWIGAAISVCGLFLLCVDFSSDTSWFGVGELVLLIGAIFWALHIIVVDSFVETVSSLKFAVGQYFVCSVLSCAGALIFEETHWSNVVAAGIPMLYGGIMSVGVAYTLQILGQRNADPTAASIILSTESVFSAIGGALFLSESMLPQGYFGCVLIFIGIVLSQLKKKQPFLRQDKQK